MGGSASRSRLDPNGGRRLARGMGGHARSRPGGRRGAVAGADARRRHRPRRSGRSLRRRPPRSDGARAGRAAGRRLELGRRRSPRRAGGPRAAEHPRRCSRPSWRMVRSNGSSASRRACRHSRSWSRRAKRRCALPQRPRRCRSSWPAMPTVSAAAGLSCAAARCSRRRISCACRALAPKPIWPRGGLDPGRPIPISVAAIVHEGRAALVCAPAPPRLGAAGGRSDHLRCQAGRHGRRRRDARARQHDLASAAGRAQVDLPPVDLAPGQLQPGQLSPRLGDMMQDVSGRLALDGAVGWGAGRRARRSGPARRGPGVQPPVRPASSR